MQLFKKPNASPPAKEQPNKSTGLPPAVKFAADPVPAAAVAAPEAHKKSAKVSSKEYFEEMQKGLSNAELHEDSLKNRKGNRGFTVSIGKKTQKTDEELGRVARRTQSMPLMSKRADIELSEAAKAQVEAAQGALVAKIKSGAVKIAMVSSDDMAAFGTNKSPVIALQIFGKVSVGQAPFTEKEISAAGASSAEVSKILQELGCALSSTKGCKGNADASPNQDNFSITRVRLSPPAANESAADLQANSVLSVCVFDGHGPNGHHVSYRAARVLPYYFGAELQAALKALPGGGKSLKSKFPREIMERVISGAFTRTQADLVKNAVEDEYDIQASGTTAVAMFILPKVSGSSGSLKTDSEASVCAYLAHTGDSRAILGYELASSTGKFVESEKTVVCTPISAETAASGSSSSSGSNSAVCFETVDHKPTSMGEKERIETSGGEIRTFKYDDNFSVSRIFVKGTDYPGLCMSRSLGDECLKSCGVSAEPEISALKLGKPGKIFAYIASDGVWEFLPTDLVGRTLSRKISEGPAKVLSRINTEARKRWRTEEGDYCDDITGIVLSL